MFFSKKIYNIIIKDKNITLQAKSGTNLYKLLLDEKLINPSLCNGAGQCGKCRVKFFGNNIPKPVYKEILSLAKINIDAGFRLACQQTIKKDIEIDISEISSSAKFFMQDNKQKNNENTDNENDIENKMANNENSENNEYNDTISISDFAPEQTVSKNIFDIKKEEGPTDGILLIQQRNGIRYYCYSAAIDNIVSEGVHKGSEPLRDIIDNDMLPDFLFSQLKIRDIERHTVPYSRISTFLLYLRE